LVKFAKVEAVYKSFSTLVLLSVPVFIWNLLPEDPACSFVGYVTSTNIMKALPNPSKVELLEQAKVKVANTAVKSPNESDFKGAKQRKLFDQTAKACCSRCHNRKTRCDASNPSCRPCEKAKLDCFYPVPKKRIVVNGTYLGALEQNQS